MKQEGGETKKRISFLMPYIDFCFMLIIIFVGMLSIAYFEPLGSTDLETEKERTIDKLQGQHEEIPVGVQVRNTGVGEDEPTGAVHPLYRRPAAGARAGRTQQRTVRGTGPATRNPAPNAAANPAENKGADPKELERLKKELEQKKKQIQELEKRQGVPQQEIKTGDDEPGNSYYIDLRGKTPENGGPSTTTPPDSGK